jgi:purine nucleoside phosphorylase
MSKTASVITDSLFKALREDPELYYAYQANIAMAFVDTYHNYKKKMDKASLNYEDIHTIANEAAQYFLNLLIKPID